MLCEMVGTPRQQNFRLIFIINHRHQHSGEFERAIAIERTGANEYDFFYMSVNPLKVVGAIFRVLQTDGVVGRPVYPGVVGGFGPPRDEQ